jgi:hypothetical protein
MKEKIERLKRLNKKLALLGWLDLKRLGINAQQVVKIKKGETARFREKTLERLEAAVK